MRDEGAAPLRIRCLYVGHTRLASGVPVIGTSAPGLRQVLPPEGPFKVGMEDAKALGNLIADFLDGAFDKGRLRGMVARWGENFTVEKMVEACETAYRDYLSLNQVPHRERMAAR